MAFPVFVDPSDRPDWIDQLLEAGKVVVVIAQPGTIEAFPATPRDLACDDIIVAGPLRIDLTQRLIHCGGVPVHASGREFDLLTLLARRPGTVRSFRDLYERVWGEGFIAPTPVISAVKRLRGRLPALPGVELEAVRGIGYRLAIRDRSEIDPIAALNRSSSSW